MKLILPLILLLVGTGGGVGAAMFLAPAPEPETALAECLPADGDVAALHASAAGDETHDTAELDENGDPVGGPEYVRLNNQFVVPVVSGDRVSALVILSISVEVAAGTGDQILLHEPKLRDAFLEILFDHANVGGFDGNFTSTRSMAPLRAALRTAAQEVIGSDARGILILDMVRQDVPA